MLMKLRDFDRNSGLGAHEKGKAIPVTVHEGP
jgi:hypothetical protein